MSRAVPFSFLGTAQGVLPSAARPQAKAWWATALRVFRATWAEKTCKNVAPTPRVTIIQREGGEMQETTTHTEPTRTQTSKKTTTRDEEGEREREREREKRSARFPSDPDWRSRLWVKTLAPCWIGCSALMGGMAVNGQAWVEGVR